MIKYEKDEGTSYCLGITLCFELLNKKRDSARKLYLSPELEEGETRQRLISLARQANIPVIVNNAKAFKGLSDKDNVLAIGEFSKFSDKLDENKDHVVLCQPMNMGNIGTIMRSPLAFGIKDLAIIGPNADYFDPKAVRASMGTIFSLRIHRYQSFGEYQAEFPNHSLYPFMLQASKLLGKQKLQFPCSLIFGNEAKGLDQSFLHVGTPLLIKISGELDSLNLDNAASIALFEYSREKDHFTM